jgi:hypothetical protein
MTQAISYWIGQSVGSGAQANLDEAAAAACPDSGRHLAEHRLPFRLMLESTTSTTLLR